MGDGNASWRACKSESEIARLIVKARISWLTKLMLYFEKVTQQNAWEKLSSFLGFPPALPAPYPLPVTSSDDAGQPPKTTNASHELILGIYMAYLSSFEEQWHQSKQAQPRAEPNRQQSEGGNTSTASGPPNAEKAEVLPPAAAPPTPAPETSASVKPTKSIPPPIETTTYPPQPPIQAPPISQQSPATPMTGVSTATSSPGLPSGQQQQHSPDANDSKKRKRQTKKGEWLAIGWYRSVLDLPC